MSFTDNPFLNRRKKSHNNIAQDEKTEDDSLSSVSESATRPVEALNKGSLPVSPNYPARAAIGSAAVFNALLEDDDDGNYQSGNSPTQESRKYGMLEGEDETLQKIQEIRKKLNKQYPMGGIKTSRILTTEILMEAPADYFDKYSDAVSDGVKWVRNNLTKDNKSEVIRSAEMNPTDDAYQEAAYSIVWGFASDYLSSTSWQGAHRAIITAMISNEIIGFGRIDPLWRDRKIDEILCNGPFDVQVEISGELYKVPSCKFDSQAHLLNLIERLYRAVGKTISQTTPIVKGRLHDKSRMQATHTSISPDGPNFAIRRHPVGYWTPEAMVERGAASEELMAFIGNQIYKGASFLVIGGTHSGKMQPYDTLIHTPSGSTTLGEIQPGDRVFDHNGNVANVTDIFPQPAQQVYAVEFSNGETEYAGAEHNWYVSTHQSRKLNKGHKTNKIKDEREQQPLYSVMTTKEMMDSGVLHAGNKKCFQFHVPKLLKAVEYENSRSPEELPIHPYLFGSSQAFNPKGEILDAFKYSTKDARKEIIAGVIDAIGNSSNSFTGWEVSFSDQELAESFIQIAASLGYVVNKETEKSENGNTIWHISIKTTDTLSKLPKNMAHHQEMIESSGVSLDRQDGIAITNIYPVEGRIEEMKCITVDSPDSTYMIGKSFITTHNTSMLNALTGFYKPKVRILTLEDNLEMKPNPKKFLAAALECRDAAIERPNDTGTNMRDLVKVSMQLRPDAIVVGEVTDQAAYDLCQALNTGHAGASTVHANGSEAAVTRVASLITQGGTVTTEGALEMISQAFDFIVSIKHFPIDGSRRIVSIDEVESTPVEIDGRLTLSVRPLWRFVSEGLNEHGKIHGYWEHVNDISQGRVDSKMLDIEDNKTWEELRELSNLPEGVEKA